jgi:hypothetical protein
VTGAHGLREPLCLAQRSSEVGVSHAYPPPPSPPLTLRAWKCVRAASLFYRPSLAATRAW